MREVRGEHQGVFAQGLDRLAERELTLVELDGLEVLRPADVLAGLVLERRQRVPAHLGQLVEAGGPEGQPAVAALERRQTQLRVAVQHAGADQRRHVALGIPHVAGGALQEHVVPGVPHAGGIGDGHGEGVDDHRQIVLLRRRPDRLPVGIVQRHRGRTDGKDADRPRLPAAAADLGHRGGHVPARDQDDAGQPVRIGRAVVLEEAVIGLVHGQLEPDVVQAAERGHAPGGQDHVHVDALDVHVLHTGVRIEADAVARKRRPLPAHVPGSAAVLEPAGDGRRRRHALPGTEAAIQVRTLAHHVPRHAGPGGGAPDQWLERQLGPIGSREIRLDGFDGFDDVGVCVEDAIAGACHELSPRRGSPAPQLGVERVPQGIPEQVEAEHPEADRDAREHSDPRRLLGVGGGGPGEHESP